MLKTYELQTTQNGVFDITEQIREAVAQSGIEDGIAIVMIPHTTAGVTIISFWDPLGLEDVNDEICRLIPTRIDFKHQHDTPQDAAGHVKSVIVGASMSLIVDNGAPLLGHSQGVYFFEFDGPRQRKFHVKVANC